MSGVKKMRVWIAVYGIHICQSYAFPDTTLLWEILDPWIRSVIRTFVPQLTFPALRYKMLSLNSEILVSEENGLEPSAQIYFDWSIKFSLNAR
jgi:hypothetical protein